MASTIGARVVETCESLCDELRGTVGLTLFRIELERRTSPLVVTLRATPRASISQVAVASSVAPARLERPLVHDGRVVGTVRIEDERRGAYPDDAATAIDAVLPKYAGACARLIDEGQL